MPVYQYQAIDQGKRCQGFVTADTAAQGRSLLRKRGLEILQFNVEGSHATGKSSWSIPRLSIGRNRKAIDEATHYLGMLLRAGVPLTEALNLIIRQVPRRIEPVLRRLIERVNGGADLALAMSEQGRIFDSTYVGIVRVGQISGMLETCLDRLVQLRRRQHELRQRIQGALAYPVIVAMVGLAVVTFLMTFVVPKIIWVLQQSGRSLPFPTKVLLTLSNGVREFWWLGLAGAAIVAALLYMADREKRVRKWVKRRFLQVPILGPLAMKAAIAQASAMLSTMLRSGLPLDEGLAITCRSTGNILLQEELARMLEALRSGRPMINPSRDKRVLPPVVAHMLAVGEQTGQMEEMLEELTQSFDTEVEVASKQAVAILEPILIVAMSVVVGFIVLATILPILKISGSF
jgi:type II secretory pathway component PulF